MKKKCCLLWDNKENYCRKNQTHISYLIIEKNVALYEIIKKNIVERIKQIYRI